MLDIPKLGLVKLRHCLELILQAMVRLYSSSNVYEYTTTGRESQQKNIKKLSYLNPSSDLAQWNL